VNSLGFSLQQLVDKPTRGNNILDLVLTNIPDRIVNVNGVNNLLGTDYLAVEFMLALKNTIKLYREDRCTISSALILEIC